MGTGLLKTTKKACHLVCESNPISEA